MSLLLRFKPPPKRRRPQIRSFPFFEAAGPAGLLYNQATVGFPSGSSSSQLTLPGTPSIGDWAVVTLGMWSESVPGHTNQGITPTVGMLSDNNGGTAGSYTAIITLTKDEIQADTGGNTNPGGIIVMYRPITSVSNLPYTFTVDPDPGGSGEAWWTWGVYSIPGIVGVNVTSKDHRPNPSFPGAPVALVPFGTCSPTKTRTLALYHGHNAFHEAELEVHDPPTYTPTFHYEENSNGWSGHGGYKYKLEDTSAESPTMIIDILSGSGAPYSSGVLVLFELDGASDIGNTFNESVTLGLSASESFSGSRSITQALTMGLTATAAPGGNRSMTDQLNLLSSLTAGISGGSGLPGLTSLAAIGTLATVLNNNVNHGIILGTQGTLSLSRINSLQGNTSLVLTSGLALDVLNSSLSVVALNNVASLTGAVSLIRDFQLALQGIGEFSATGTVGSVVYEFILELASSSNISVSPELALAVQTNLASQGSLNSQYQFELACVLHLALVSDVQVIQRSIVEALLMLGIQANIAQYSGRSFIALLELAIVSTLESAEGGLDSPVLEGLQFVLEKLRMYGITQEKLSS